MAKHLREISQSELDDTVELAWEKTFDISSAKTPEVPARIRAALIGPGKPPTRR